MTSIATDASSRAHAKGHVPGQSAMWVFIIGDLFIFTGWFVFYMLNREQNMDVFLASQEELSQIIGAINTLILLTSSWFVALSVQSAREKKYEWAVTLTFWTMGCGALFLMSKAYEWTSKAIEGHDPTFNDFFTYYYFLTGIHLFHVICGFVFLGVMAREMKNPRLRSMSVIEASATYWHMVDLLWVMVFAMLYLVR